MERVRSSTTCAPRCPPDHGDIGVREHARLNPVLLNTVKANRHATGNLNVVAIQRSKGAGLQQPKGDSNVLALPRKKRDCAKREVRKVDQVRPCRCVRPTIGKRYWRIDAIVDGYRHAGRLAGDTYCRDPYVDRCAVSTDIRRSYCYSRCADEGDLFYSSQVVSGYSRDDRIGDRIGPCKPDVVLAYRVAAGRPGMATTERSGTDDDRWGWRIDGEELCACETIHPVAAARVDRGYCFTRCPPHFRAGTNRVRSWPYIACDCCLIGSDRDNRKGNLVVFVRIAHSDQHIGIDRNRVASADQLPRLESGSSYGDRSTRNRNGVGRHHGYARWLVERIVRAAVCSLEHPRGRSIGRAVRVQLCDYYFLHRPEICVVLRPGPSNRRTYAIAMRLPGYCASLADEVHCEKCIWKSILRREREGG